jgi:aminoglycoside phosphotransferase (APT) family kinase protein
MKVIMESSGGMSVAMIETVKADDFRQRLAEYLEAVTEKDVDVDALQQLAGGASRDSWLVKAKVGSELQQFVLRCDLVTTMYDKALERDQEFLVMKAAHEIGILVPRPRWYCLEPAILDQPFLIMDFVDGVSIGSKVVNQPELVEARAALPGQMGEQLAKIHALDTIQFKLNFLPRPRVGFSPAQEAIAQIRAMILKLAVHNPVFEFGLRWLQQNAPKTDKSVFLQGDFRVGNFLVGNKGLNGIIDWEFARIGDPLEDLAWPCLRDWRYGKGQFRLGGIGKREPFILAYERASGRTVDRKAVDYWEILGNLRWAVTCLAQANRHLSGGDFSVELAGLGRRSAEMQFEMLRLIEAQGLKDHV